MAALTGKVYMITEANTGSVISLTLYARALTPNLDLGRALVFQYFQRPESTVIATIKTQDTPFEQYTDSVEKHFKTAKSVCIILRMDSADPTTFPGAVTTLQSDDHVSRIDVIIFNGPKINDHVPKPLTEVDLAHVEKYITHCTVGPLRFLQAMLPLLRPASSEHRPQFVLVGSANGSTYHMETQPANMGAYGTFFRSSFYPAKILTPRF